MTLKGRQTSMHKAFREQKVGLVDDHGSFMTSR
jgi:hypothetical protein